jgi:hypothetical protein
MSHELKINILDDIKKAVMQNFFVGDDNMFGWVFQPFESTYDYKEAEKYKMEHLFYSDALRLSNPTIDVLAHLLKYVNAKKIYRVQANLILKTENNEPFDFKIKSESQEVCNRAIYFMNSSDAYIELENGEKIPASENCLLIFPSDMKYTYFSPTNEKSQCFITMTYDKNEEE